MNSSVITVKMPVDLRATGVSLSAVVRSALAAWVADEKMTVADLAACAHLSANDYVGAVPWKDFPQAREWYARLKCRPSFRPLLADRVEGLPPPSHYADLDF